MWIRFSPRAYYRYMKGFFIVLASFFLIIEVQRREEISILFPLDWVCMCWLSVTGDLKSLYLFNSRRLLELPFIDCPSYDFASLAQHLLWWSSGVQLGGVEEHGSF